MNQLNTAYVQLASRLVMSTLLLITSTTNAQPAPARAVFEDRFTDGIKPQWSANHLVISSTPAGDKHYLGPFAGESALLKLTDLPDHRMVRLSMDLLISGEWFGNTSSAGPDVFYIYSDDGRVIYATSFGWNGQQAYPGFFSVHSAPAGSGATVINAIGPAQSEGIFRVECLLPHEKSTLGLRFLATTPLPVARKSWGILNARVTLEEPAPLDEAGLTQAWDKLGATDPSAAAAAVWDLVGAGEPAVKFLSGKLEQSAIPQDVELLDPTRVAARRKPTNGSDGFEIANSTQRGAVLAAYVLQVIGSDTAKEAMRKLHRQSPGPGRTVKLTARDSNSREPLPFIPFSVMNSSAAMLSLAVVTDANGQATVDFPQDVAGTIRFQNTNAVYVPIINQASSTAQFNTELLLERAAPIGGVVVDDNQKPVAGATVRVAIGRRTSTRGTTRQLTSVVTDRLGRWTLDMVPEQPELIQIGVQSPGDTSGLQLVDFAKQLPELHANTAKIVMPHQETLHATVVDTDSAKPIEKFRVSYSLIRQGGNMMPWQALAADISPGAFEVPVPPSYEAVTIRVEADDYKTATSEFIPRAKMRSPLEMKLRKQIVELSLEDPSSHQAKSYLDLDSGKIFTYGESTPENFVQSRRWIGESGVDLMCESRQPAEGFVAYDMILIPTDASIDRPRSFDELKKLLDEHQPEPFKIVSTPAALLPKTYLFRTREGLIGMLEASAITETPSGMRLRYKLVPKPEPAPADPNLYRGGVVVFGAGQGQINVIGNGQLILQPAPAVQAQQAQQLLQRLDARQEAMIAAQQQNLAQLQQQLQQLRQTLGADHPQVLVIQQQINAINALQQALAQQPAQAAATEQRARLQLQQQQVVAGQQQNAPAPIPLPMQVPQQPNTADARMRALDDLQGPLNQLRLLRPENDPQILLLERQIDSLRVSARGTGQPQTNAALIEHARLQLQQQLAAAALSAQQSANAEQIKQRQKLAELYGERASVQSDLDAAYKKLGDRKAVGAEAAEIDALRAKLGSLQMEINRVEATAQPGTQPSTRPAAATPADRPARPLIDR